MEPHAVEGAPEGARRPREHWFVLGAALASLVAVLVLGTVLEPDARGYGTHTKMGLRPCLPMELWEIPCPGCGVTTSVSLAAHGRVWDSIVNQPFGFVVALGLIAFGVWAPIAHLRGRDLWAWLQGVRFGKWSRAIGAFVVLAWAYKLWLVQSGAS